MSVACSAQANLTSPLVLVLLNGGPISSPWAFEHANAVLEAFYPGYEVRTVRAAARVEGKGDDVLTCDVCRAHRVVWPSWTRCLAGRRQPGACPSLLFVRLFVCASSQLATTAFVADMQELPLYTSTILAEAPGRTHRCAAWQRSVAVMGKHDVPSCTDTTAEGRCFRSVLAYHTQILGVSHFAVPCSRALIVVATATPRCVWFRPRSHLETTRSLYRAS